MSTIIEELARWASTLTVDQIPLASRQRALLQHMHVASACRQRSGNSIPVRCVPEVPRGGSVVVEDALLDETLYEFGFGWMALSGRPFVSCEHGYRDLPAAWAHAKGRTIGEILVATVAANEIGGRLGASMAPGADDDASGIGDCGCSAFVLAYLV